MHRTSARPAPLDFLLPPAHSIYGIDRRKDIGLSHPLTQLTPTYLEAPVRDGLRTPPADDMSTTYQHPQYNNYVSRQDTTYQNGGSASNYAPAYSGLGTHSRSYSTLSQPPLTSNSTLRSDVPVSQPPYSQPPSPQPSNRTNHHAHPEGMPQRKNNTGDMILPNLQIPKSINNSGGSLAEFAAQITCLFWFESTETLNKAEELSTSSLVQRLREEALPSSGFRKWVVTILSTTQVTQNVILLALLFIYRLKKINPAVKGRSGSEYRLLTVALMLGNKFLDDNTYTNKTWAEVSGISVTEIHVMEVEFLSNMRYSLLASEEQWEEWQKKLGKFWLYCDQAGKTPLPQYSPQAVPVLHPTLPSPPSSLQSSPPSATTSYLLSNGSITNSHQWPDLHVHSSTRKRSFDGDTDEPAAKRPTRPSTTVPTPYSTLGQLTRNEAPRLPVPNLTISTGLPLSNGYNGPANLSQNVPLLPPLSGRAMSTVYPSTSQSWTPHLPLLTPTGPPTQQCPQSASGYSTPTRRHSPHSVQDLLSLGSSPISANFPGHNPGHISPSFFLQQRASPYKPVRHVNTLLYPPPSASMHDYSANIDQMHYQPLGKRNDYRPGIVPDYTSHTPYQWNGPTLRQPNFHV